MKLVFITRTYFMKGEGREYVDAIIIFADKDEIEDIHEDTTR